MTAKEFVLSKMPTAKAERQVSGRVKGMKEVYWLIRKRGDSMWFAQGGTESKAWKEAKERIEEIDKQASVPDQKGQLNRVLFKEIEDCAEMLTNIGAKVELKDVVIDAAFGFAGDRNTYRQVIDVDGEYALMETKYDSSGSEPKFHKVHYSHLRPSESIWLEQNNGNSK